MKTSIVLVVSTFYDQWKRKTGAANWCAIAVYKKLPLSQFYYHTSVLDETALRDIIIHHNFLPTFSCVHRDPHNPAVRALFRLVSKISAQVCLWSEYHELRDLYSLQIICSVKPTWVASSFLWCSNGNHSVLECLFSSILAQSQFPSPLLNTDNPARVTIL